MKPSAQDKKLIRQIQGDLSVSKTPFASLALRVGLDEKTFLKKVHFLIRRKIIRRFGAILRHQIAGFRGNAMVVWKVDEDQVSRVGRAVASFPAVSHCYLRPSLASWRFNLYAMVHGRNEAECRSAARMISRKTGIKEYRLLFSKREHKKSSMRYFEK